MSRRVVFPLLAITLAVGVWYASSGDNDAVTRATNSDMTEYEGPRDGMSIVPKASGPDIQSVPNKEPSDATPVPSTTDPDDKTYHGPRDGMSVVPQVPESEVKVTDD